MKRREFITLIGGTVAVWPLAARAQHSIPVVGFLNGASAWEFAHVVSAFRRGLSESGYADGGNVFVDYRWAEGRYERLPVLAADLVRRQVKVIAANTPAVPAAKEATADIPIVFTTAADPVAAGFVASLNRPGRNLTGVTTLNVELAPKRLELLREVVPAATSIGFLINPKNPNAAIQVRDVRAAAQSLGLQLHVFHASDEHELEAQFPKVVAVSKALVIGPDALFIGRPGQIATLALRHGIATMFQFPEFTAAGGLMSYGSSQTEAFRQVGLYVGRILKGENPAELPVQQATKVELTINLKTANALGLKLPNSLLARADEVIE